MTNLELNHVGGVDFDLFYQNNNDLLIAEVKSIDIKNKYKYDNNKFIMHNSKEYKNKIDILFKFLIKNNKKESKIKILKLECILIKNIIHENSINYKIKGKKYFELNFSNK